jgi:hypothetical protein
MERHVHRMHTISHASDPARPYVLRACDVGTCIFTAHVCVLCEQDDSTRRHRQHLGSTDEAVLERIEAGKIASYLRDYAARPDPARP